MLLHRIIQYNCTAGYNMYGHNLDVQSYYDK